MLNDVVNKKNLPYAVIHGTYDVEPVLNQQSGDKIHVVYAGTLSKIKGGAYAAAESARFLGENYRVHILGFGNNEQVEEIKALADKISAENGCRVSYDGCLSGEKYLRFIQACHIGLSTQNPQGGFNETSFPSKILTYMANGLQVVSARIPVVECSAVNDYIIYYDSQTPENIASAIKNVDLKNCTDTREIIRELNKDFKEKIKEVL
jgi:hypothetical protein